MAGHAPAVERRINRVAIVIQKRRAPVPFLVLGVLLVGVVAGGPAAAPVRAASLNVRLEAGPQTGVTFDAAWRVATRRTVTLARPVAVTASVRSSRPATGTWLRLTSGTLAGRWVRESRVAYVPAIVDVRPFTSPRSATLQPGAWERYRFDAGGALVEARGEQAIAPTSVTFDRSAMIRGARHVRVASGAWAGWWLPGSAATPVSIGCSAGARASGPGPVTLRSVPAAAGRIALTFDMGGRLTPALSIIRYLELERVCATIFATGAAADTPIGRAVLAEVAAHPELFELGNHTQHHCDLANGGGGAACPADPSAAFVQSELRDAEAVIEGISGLHTIPYWRPPYGSVNATVRQAA